MFYLQKENNEGKKMKFEKVEFKVFRMHKEPSYTKTNFHIISLCKLDFETIYTKINLKFSEV